MSRFSNLRIAKGGKLLADEWIYNKEKQKGKTINDVDVTNTFMYRLRNDCVLDNDIVFRDVLLLIENINKYDMLSPILTAGPWLKDIVDEGLSGDPDDEPHIDNIVMSWAVSVMDDFYNEGQSEFSSYIHIYGTSKEDPETWALDLTPLYKLSNCTINVNREFLIEDEQKESLKNREIYLSSLSEEERSNEKYCPVIAKTNKNFTLYDIIHGLFWELSYHGGPKDRETRFAELTDSVLKIKSGEDKGILWEDLKEKLKEELK